VGVVVMRVVRGLVLDDGVLEKGGNVGEGEGMGEEGMGMGTVIRVWIYIRLFRGFLSLSPRIHIDETNTSLLHNRHLMVRHGLLSPNSKLLPRESESRMDVDGRPGSILSVVSTGACFVPFIS